MRLSTIADISALVRGRRQELGLSALELSNRANVSRPWLSDLEAGKATVEMGLVLRVLDALDIELSADAGPPPPTRPNHDDDDDIDLDHVLDAYSQRS